MYYDISPQESSHPPSHSRRSASGLPHHPQKSRSTTNPPSHSTRLHPHHRHRTPPMLLSSSSPASSSSPPKTSRAATKLMSSVRRSFSVVTSPKKRQTNANAGILYSTPEERDSHASSRFLVHDMHDSQAPPTVEQIAMGLHVSRTPHLRQQYPYSQRHHPASTPLHPHPHHNPNAYHNHPYYAPAEQPSRRPSSSTTLPPPPTRSSLKKASTLNSGSSPRVTNPGLASVASGSSTTITSNSGPSTPHSNRSLSSLKLRVTKLLPGLRFASPSSTQSSISSSPRNSSEYHVVKKAVRFSTSDDDI